MTTPILPWQAPHRSAVQPAIRADHLPIRQAFDCPGWGIPRVPAQGPTHVDDIGELHGDEGLS